jgi:hypothetical protein
MNRSRPRRPIPRYRPPGSPPPPPPPAPDPARVQLAAQPYCGWQARAIRCVADAEVVVRSREGVLRSSCATHLAAWLRTGAVRVR